MPVSTYAVHHITPDGIIVQLGDGFGRLTKELAGNDQLAEKMLRHYASCQTLRLSALRVRDAQGYLCMSADLSDAWPYVMSLQQPVYTLLSDLYRKNTIVELGSVTTARVRKAGPSGTIFSLSDTLKAVAPLEDVSEAVTGHVRVLDYDAATGLAQVTAKEDVISGGHGGQATVVERISVGSRIQCKILLSHGTYSVVELSEERSAQTAIAYLLHPKAGSGAAKFTVGSVVDAVVEFAPGSFDVGGLVPFVVLSQREGFHLVPKVRLLPAEQSIGAPFAWRVEGKSTKGEKRDRGEDGGDELHMRRRRMEEAIDAFEREGHRAAPKSPEDFKRLLLATPNSSYLWTQYMAFHLGLQQYEEARQVAEKALQTIGVRESQDLLNVWVAYLNLENLHGTAESLTSIFRRALQHSDDPLVVHERLADIFAASKKTQQLVALCRVMSSKFRNERRVWQRLGIALIDSNKRDQLKRMIKDLADVLKKDDQAIVVEHLAIHEYRNGNVDSGRGLFDGLVSRMPKKSDVWSAFLDQELALLARKLPEGSIQHTRATFERATSISFPAKVMQGMLTRFLQFEQAHGTPADVEKVKAKAKSYVESKLSVAGAPPA